MSANRFPSLFFSLLLHILGAALLLWMPSSPPPKLPEQGQMIAGFVTIGAPGKSVPGSVEAIPEAARGRDEPAGQPPKPQEVTQPPKIEDPVKPQEKAPEILPTPPEDNAIPIVKKEEEKQPEEPKPEVKKPEEPKPEEKKPDPKPEEKKPEEKKDPPKPKEKAADVNDALRDLAAKTGTASGSKTGKGTVTKGKGKDHSSPEDALADLAKSLGGAGNDASGRGPGGTGGHGMGRRGTYEQSIISSIRRNWTNPDRIDGKRLVTTVKLVIDRDGTIAGARIMKSSGSSTFDDLVMLAIKATKKLEPPQTTDQQEIVITFTP